MKINKLFHWLYAFLMGLPLLSSLWIGLIWTFNENAQVPTITENVSKEVDFNQQWLNGGSTYNVNGIDFITYADGSIKINGTSTGTAYYAYTAETIVNHTYVVRDGNGNINQNVYIYNDGLGVSTLVNGGYGLATGTRHLYLRVNSGVTLNDYIIYPQLFDLTQMFGFGNEPSITEFNLWFNDNHYDYTLSKHIVIEDYSTRQILDSPVNYIWLPSFGGLGWTIENVFNSLISGMFGLATSYGIGLTIVKLLTYWLCISLIWLIYDVIMYVPLMIHRWLDKGVIS